MDIFRSEKSESSNICEDDFDSNFHQLSHDLRTPLNHINGFAELLLMDKGLSPTNAGYVRAILSGGATLSASVISYLERAEEIVLDPVPLPKTKSIRRNAMRARAIRPKFSVLAAVRTS